MLTYEWKIPATLLTEQRTEALVGSPDVPSRAPPTLMPSFK